MIWAALILLLVVVVGVLIKLWPKVIPIPLWCIDCDGTYQYYVFALTSEQAQEELAKLLGMSRTVDWRRSMQQSWGTETFDVRTIDEGHIVTIKNERGDYMSWTVSEWRKRSFGRGLLGESDF